MHPGGDSRMDRKALVPSYSPEVGRPASVVSASKKRGRTNGEKACALVLEGEGEATLPAAATEAETAR